MIGCYRNWFNQHRLVEDSGMQQSVWDQLSDRERNVLASFSTVLVD